MTNQEPNLSMNRGVYYEVKEFDQNADAMDQHAVRLAAEILNTSATGEFSDLPIDEDENVQLPDGSTVRLVEIVALAIKSNMAAAYLAGRSDQIADSTGSNMKRTIRCRDLPKTIDVANMSRSNEKIDKKEVIGLFNGERGAPRVYVAVTDEYEAELRARIESGDLDILSNKDIEVMLVGPRSEEVNRVSEGEDDE